MHPVPVPVPVPRKVPVILSRDEVARLIGAAGNLKNQTLLAVAYGAGLSANEVVSLKVGDIDGQRGVLRIEQGKGHKDRYTPCSHPSCSTACVPGGERPVPMAGYSMAAGYFPA